MPAGLVTIHEQRLMEVRLVFLHVLKQEYMAMLDEGIVHGSSSLIHGLLHSADVAADRVYLPLYDWVVISNDMKTP